ncbi:LysR family transcriptional regulator [Paramixta manurensis]|uniref:LysR family transcriptional regulator n=2 Tax=Paramixta manurensis TaxID=2740817 RepID=A0A6M8U8Y1_9GAMM|nr:LysR family transcriptional regulator [Erwiniaceae bacterium PD-1]
MTLDIDLLRTFHAVVRLGQFRAAATQINRSPAAVSVHIQRLETVVGGKLFERDNQAVELTPLGQKLLASTAVLLKTHDKILGDLQADALTGHIKLGVPDEYAAHVIGDILPVFSALCPGVELEVSTAPSLKLKQQVERNRLHLALTVQPVRHDHPATSPIAITLPVWVSGSEVDLEPDEPVPLALHASHCPYRDAMTTALTAAGRRWKTILSSPSARAVEACVEAGLAVSLIDRSRITARMRQVSGLPPIGAHEVLIARAASTDALPAVDALATAISQHFKL